MPIFEYHCSHCEHEFALLQKMDAQLFMLCPECGLEAQRKISVTNAQFKGPGFYSTDNRNDKRID